MAPPRQEGEITQLVLPIRLAEAQREVEAGCVKIWSLYKGSGAGKNEAAVGMLLEGLADAQFVGLASPTVSMMESELTALFASGVIKRGP